MRCPSCQSAVEAGKEKCAVCHQPLVAVMLAPIDQKGGTSLHDSVKSEDGLPSGPPVIASANRIASPNLVQVPGYGEGKIAADTSGAWNRAFLVSLVLTAGLVCHSCSSILHSRTRQGRGWMPSRAVLSPIPTRPLGGRPSACDS
jgi:hypothetical protein